MTRHRRMQIFKATTFAFSLVAVALSALGYFGGFFNNEVEADSDQAQVRPKDTKPANPAADPPQAAPATTSFPDINVQYRVTRAITGAVIGVNDVTGQERRITVLGARAPKLDENFGPESLESLAGLVANKSVSIRLRKFTRESDTIAEVTVDGINIGLAQIKSGMALLSVEELVGLQEAEKMPYLEVALFAKNGGIGLWSGKHSASFLARNLNTETAPSGGIADVQATGNVQIHRPKPAVPKRSDADRPVADPPLEYRSVVEETTQPVVVPEPKEDAPIPVEPAKQAASPREIPPMPAQTSGRKFLKGPYGGCYYINSGGNKTYVDRKKCG